MSSSANSQREQGPQTKPSPRRCSNQCSIQQPMKRIENQNCRRFLAVGFLSSVFLSGCAVGPNYKAPQTSVAASFANSPTNVAAADETALATWWKGFEDVKLNDLV